MGRSATDHLLCQASCERKSFGDFGFRWVRTNGVAASKVHRVTIVRKGDEMDSTSKPASVNELTGVILSKAQVCELYQRHSRELWTGFYARCRDAELASDLVQEAFSRLWKNRRTITRPLSWLKRVGVNLLIDRARRLASRPEMISGTDLLQSEADEPWQHLAALESRAWVTSALQKLRESDREILVLRYAHDLGSRAIGEQLSIGADAVDMRLSRARRRLLKAFVSLESGRRRARSGLVPLGQADCEVSSLASSSIG